MSDPTQKLFVYVIFETPEQAKEIARDLLELRLVACANIFPAHESLYWWTDKIQSATETAVIFKTTSEHYPRLENAIKERHSYECPCIVAMPIEKGSLPFLDWIEKETSGGGV